MSRIAELTTRSAKLNTGTAYFPVDQSSEQVTNKIDYAELARQIITEYNAQTLAGTAQSVKSALDTLKSDMATTTGFNNITTQVPSLDDIPLNTYGLVALPAELSPTGSARQFFYQCYGTSTRATLDLINVGTANSGRYFSKKESTNWSDWQTVISKVQLDELLTRQEILIRTNDFTQTIDLTGSWGVYAIVTVPRGNNGFQIFIVSRYDSTHAYIVELYSTPDLGDTYKITATLDESANVVISRAGTYTTYINVILLKLK